MHKKTYSISEQSNEKVTIEWDDKELRVLFGDQLIETKLNKEADLFDDWIINLPNGSELRLVFQVRPFMNYNILVDGKLLDDSPLGTKNHKKIIVNNFYATSAIFLVAGLFADKFDWDFDKPSWTIFFVGILLLGYSFFVAEKYTKPKISEFLFLTYLGLATSVYLDGLTNIHFFLTFIPLLLIRIIIFQKSDKKGSG